MDEIITKKKRISKLENYERTLYIYKLRMSGKTYEDIGKSFSPSLSRQRIHQIVLRHAKRLGVSLVNSKEEK